MTLKHWHGIPYSDDGFCGTAEEVKEHDDFWFKVLFGCMLVGCVEIFIAIIIVGVING
jgi:hypothetical protein